MASRQKTSDLQKYRYLLQVARNGIALAQRRAAEATDAETSRRAEFDLAEFKRKEAVALRWIAKTPEQYPLF